MGCKRKKRGQIDASSTIVPLIVGVGVAVMIIILVSMLGGKTYELVQDDIQNLTNHSATILDRKFETNVQYYLDSYIQPNTFSVKNATVTLTAANYTIDYDSGAFMMNNASTYNLSNVNVSYYWGAIEIRDSIKSGITNSFEALEQTGNYLPIIVLAIVIFLVLGSIMMFTGMKKGGSGGGAL